MKSTEVRKSTGTQKHSSVTPVPSADFRPNPRRSVFLSGSITAAMVETLSPQILRLLDEGREPITVYIDSAGGSVFHASVLITLLRSTDQDSRPPCRLITVVTSRAISAAADFLATGDYAIAYANSLIHFHGARTRKENTITTEQASDVARELKASNNQAAIALSKSCKSRFFFRFTSLCSSFEELRLSRPTADAENWFIERVLPKLSNLGHRVVNKAKLRNARYQAVSDFVMKSRRVNKAIAASNKLHPERYRILEAEILKAIIAYELATNKKNKDWRFANLGISQLTSDFLLLDEYLSHFDGLQELCEIWEDFLLTAVERTELQTLTGADRARRVFEMISPQTTPLWFFFAALCHTLQEEENPLLATDAFWLGLIDEVIGEDLPTMRKVVEHTPSTQRART